MTDNCVILASVASTSYCFCVFLGKISEIFDLRF